MEDEIERLKARVDSLLESNNAYLQRARDAERQLNVSVSGKRALEARIFDLEQALAVVADRLRKVDKRLGSISIPDNVKAVTVEMLTEELRTDLMEAIDVASLTS